MSVAKVEGCRETALTGRASPVIAWNGEPIGLNLKRTGMFVLHGFAPFVVFEKPGRPAREGTWLFTKVRRKFAAKPASKEFRARPVKAIRHAAI